MAGTTYSGVATVTADLTEATRLSKEATVKAQEASNIGGFGNLVGTAAQVATSEYSKASAEGKAQKDLTDSYTAKSAAESEAMAFSRTHNDQETLEFIELKQAEYTQQYKDGVISDGTYKGNMAIWQNAHGPALAKKQEEVDSKNQNVVSGSNAALILSGSFDKEARSSQRGVALKSGMSNEGWKNSVLNGYSEAGTTVITLAESPEKLDEGLTWIYKNINDLEGEDNFYSGKQYEAKKAKILIAINKAVTVKKREFKAQGQQILATNAQSNYDLPSYSPEVSRGLELAYPDDAYTREKAGVAIDVKYQKARDEEHIELSRFENPLTDHELTLYKDNKAVADETAANQMDEAMDYGMNTGDFTYFESVSGNAMNFLEGWGTRITNRIDSVQTSAELQPYMQQLTTLSETGNAYTLNQAIGSDKVAETVATFYMAEALFEGDMKKSRDFYRQQLGAPAKNFFDKSLNADIQGYATKLGPLASKYNAIMQNVKNIDPSIGKKMAKDLFKYFDKQRGSQSKLFGGDATLDTSMGGNYFKANSLNQDGGEWDTQDTIYNAENALNMDIATMKFVGNRGTVLYSDEFGRTVLGSVKRDVDEKNANQLANPPKASTLDKMGTVISATAPELVAGPVGSIGKLGSVFTEYLGKQTQRDLDSFASGWDNIKNFFTEQGVEPADMPEKVDTLKKDLEVVTKEQQGMLDDLLVSTLDTMSNTDISAANQAAATTFMHQAVNMKAIKILDNSTINFVRNKETGELEVADRTFITKEDRDATAAIRTSQQGTGMQNTVNNTASIEGTKEVLSYLGRGITNQNDSANAPSPDLTNLTGEAINALKYLADNTQSFNINSSWGGKHSEKSGHYVGQGIDINKYNGMKLTEIGKLSNTSLQYKQFKQEMVNLSKQEGVQFLLTPIGEFKNGKYDSRVAKGHHNHIHIETTFDR